MSLDELFRALEDGEPRAEPRLYRRLRLEMLWFFKKRVDTFEVEDLTQQTLELIARVLKAKLFEPREPGAFRSFVYVLAHYQLRAHYTTRQRHRRKRDAPGSWVTAPELSPAEATLTLERATLLGAAMAAIKTRYRRALESRLLDQDPREFAEAEGIELGTVRSRIHRALLLIEAEIQARRMTPREPTPTPT